MRAMIYTFKSRADADLNMNAAVGDRLLTLIGKTPGPQGIIEADAIPAALAALEAAIAGEDAPATDAEADAEAAEKGQDNISLRRRAWPFMEMLRRAHAAGQPVVWGV